MSGTVVDCELSAAVATGQVAQHFEYSIARPADDSDLRKLLRNVSMDGAIRVGFTREPNYFAGEGCLGSRDATIIARRAGRLVCMGRSSERPLYLNGELRRVCYLGELRLQHHEKKGLTLLRDGYRFFREQAGHDPADFYFTSIAAENLRARRVLENGRRFGLPSYDFLAALETWAAPINRFAPSHTANASHATQEELTEFLDQRSRKRNLSTPWNSDTWAQLRRQDLSEQDFAIVRRNGRITAAAAIWDQRKFRQTVIASYASPLSWLRSLVNLGSALRGLPPLPRPGEVLPQAVLLGLTVADPTAWPELWAKLAARATRLGVQWLTWTNDSAEEIWKCRGLELNARNYRTRLYTVRWPDFPPTSAIPDGQFQPEAGFL